MADPKAANAEAARLHKEGMFIVRLARVFEMT